MLRAGRKACWAGGSVATKPEAGWNWVTRAQGGRGLVKGGASEPPAAWVRTLALALPSPVPWTSVRLLHTSLSSPVKQGRYWRLPRRAVQMVARAWARLARCVCVCCYCCGHKVGSEEWAGPHRPVGQGKNAHLYPKFKGKAAGFQHRGWRVTTASRGSRPGGKSGGFHSAPVRHWDVHNRPSFAKPIRFSEQ